MVEVVIHGSIIIKANARHYIPRDRVESAHYTHRVMRWIKTLIMNFIKLGL